MCLSGFMGYANLESREWLPNLNCMTWANLVSQDDMDTTQICWIISNRIAVSNGQPICIVRGVP